MIEPYGELKIKLWQSGWMRTFLTAIVLLIPNVQFFAKIILIIIFDTFDCNNSYYPIIPTFSKNDKNVCGSNYYNIVDKIADSIDYTLLYLYYLFYVDSPSGLKIYISYLFFLRMFGFVLFMITKNRNWFLVFPNFFLESLLVIAILQDFGFPYEEYSNVYILLLFAVIIIKYCQELIVHSIWKNKQTIRV